MNTTTPGIERLVFLQQEIKKHDELYEMNQPVITDGEYDNLYQELVALEEQHPDMVTPDSPTQRIVTTLVSSLKKVRHDNPMLSQDKVNDEAGLRKFLAKNTTGSRIIVQQKLDGLTIVDVRKQGAMKQAVTRGDGYIGEDVSHNVKTFDNVPDKIPFENDLSVRMEAIIPFDEFERINVDGSYSNPRNLASGTVRQLDSKIAAERNLLGIAFELEKADGTAFGTDVERLEFMKELGFDVVPYKVFEPHEQEALIEYCLNYNTEVRPSIPYMIDGLVIKFDDIALREQLGYTSKFPKWSCAFKFESLDATTTLRNVAFQVGKSGQITPVAEFDKINISGVNITRATLHNYSNIITKDIRIGDKIVVARANDVIPQVVKAIHAERSGEEKVVEMPSTCPSCASPTERIGENVYCTGATCKPQFAGKLAHYVSRKAMNIDGLGDKTVEVLLERNLIESFADLYRLHEKRDQFTDMEGFGEKKIDKMLKGIEDSKEMPFEKALYGLSIRLIGQSASKDVAKKFGSMENLLESSLLPNFKTELMGIEDFGETMSDSLIDYLKNPKNRMQIQEMLDLGVKMVSSETAEVAVEGTSLEGSPFVITGALSKSRDEFKALIEARGGKVSGSVSKKTTYLLMGDDANGTSKHKKAMDLGVTILSEEGFNAL
ncbi:NAD-dependent DNA ligase LigA [Exiguobacterium sp. s163]|uniref:NAD-dependent DNA ligase LigA n=1 Tax=Exiguobacterium sp. s163 TaxID=2751287 RepID=UPI001BED2E3A|nr:NAD-dependent DNA ligase LigA [Exiguobacterium sp. s163]